MREILSVTIKSVQIISNLYFFVAFKKPFFVTFKKGAFEKVKKLTAPLIIKYLLSHTRYTHGQQLQITNYY